MLIPRKFIQILDLRWLNFIAINLKFLLLLFVGHIVVYNL